MNHGKRAVNGAAGLLVAVLAIFAFVRGDAQLWLLGAAFAVWGLWMFIPMAVYAYRRIRRRRQPQRKAAPAAKKELYDFDSELAEGVLLHHVGHRITARLQSAYPSMTWDWCEKDPERIIRQGGTACIRLYGVPDFNYANVIFDQKANIDCDMMKIVPLAEAQKDAGAKAPAAKPKQEFEPQAWYELQARQVLESLITDLHSRGHSSLTIKENGDICIRQADDEVVKQSLKNFPERSCWQRLVKVFERESIAATVTEAGIVLSW